MLQTNENIFLNKTLIKNILKIKVKENRIKCQMTTNSSKRKNFYSKEYLRRNFILFCCVYIVIKIPIFGCQSVYSPYNFSTTDLDAKLSILQNRSLNLFNYDLQKNLTDNELTNYDKYYNDLKTKAQTICLDLKTKLEQKNQDYSLIISVFPPFIKTIRNIFTNLITNSNLTSTNSSYVPSVPYFDWLQDNSLNTTKVTNVTSLNGLYEYTIQNIYLIFPFVFICIFIFLSVAIFNCLYCNFCYCGSFRFTIIARSKEFFNKITLFLIILGLVFSGVYVIIQQRIILMNQYANYLTCEILNKNVITFLSNNNYARDFMKEENDTKGLIQLRDNYRNTYQKNMDKLKTDVNSSSLISVNSPLDDEMKNIQQGLNLFNQYVQNNTFAFADYNNKETGINFNFTYVCKTCKDLLSDIYNTSNLISFILSLKKF